ncbi:MAG: hypothetical protein PeribacterD1_0676 [Candidatus Peribacter riflensis]|uniref:Uncharacterized protein n=1 Tax=Candidatus Peribacter riflensis TaxID=1735162 RepID=A0A0S1SS90_9BACT|nr:MAG: hypothetical protein PeribacterB2_0676 [Candidatus Peribacter riflensis]ALM12248.1 MAG: hypothetical protein PeribacterC2_0676 [Candidatus Peribacter riflensis]ALM13350.1 MAG: hypothetical protein PeribacterD1_0676 [Candidatus Peribacter riflensis]ALM14451.1 MAG: hypothetical protein PeribacterD2_0676 [Candidatus Peribacter riflensis]
MPPLVCLYFRPPQEAAHRSSERSEGGQVRSGITSCYGRQVSDILPPASR